MEGSVDAHSVLVQVLRVLDRGAVDVAQTAALWSVAPLQLDIAACTLEVCGLVQRLPDGKSLAWSGAEAKAGHDAETAGSLEPSSLNALRALDARMDEHIRRITSSFPRTHADGLFFSLDCVRTIPALQDKTLICVSLAHGSVAEVYDPASCYRMLITSPRPIKPHVVNVVETLDNYCNAKRQCSAQPPSHASEDDERDEEFCRRVRVIQAASPVAITPPPCAMSAGDDDALEGSLTDVAQHDGATSHLLGSDVRHGHGD